MLTLLTQKRVEKIASSSLDYAGTHSLYDNLAFAFTSEV